MRTMHNGWQEVLYQSFSVTFPLPLSHSRIPGLPSPERRGKISLWSWYITRRIASVTPAMKIRTSAWTSAVTPGRTLKWPSQGLHHKRGLVTGAPRAVRATPQCPQTFSLLTEPETLLLCSLHEVFLAAVYTYITPSLEALT